MTRSGKGQSTLEYVMIVAILIAALLGIQRFLKASMMGRWKTIVDVYGFGRQFDTVKTSVVTQ